jgi:hypothetical protein
LAYSALVTNFDGLHDEPHAAGLASAVLFGAMLAEMTPLIVTAGHSILIVEAHCGKNESFGLGKPGPRSTASPETGYSSELETYWIAMNDILTAR